MEAGELRALRKCAGYKSYELAEALDLSPSTLCRYERGHAPVPRVVALAVQQLCEPHVLPKSAEERLIEAIKEVASDSAGAVKGMAQQ